VSVGSAPTSGARKTMTWKFRTLTEFYLWQKTQGRDGLGTIDERVGGKAVPRRLDVGDAKAPSMGAHALEGKAGQGSRKRFAGHAEMRGDFALFGGQRDFCGVVFGGLVSRDHIEDVGRDPLLCRAAAQALRGPQLSAQLRGDEPKHRATEGVVGSHGVPEGARGDQQKLRVL